MLEKIIAIGMALYTIKEQIMYILQKKDPLKKKLLNRSINCEAQIKEGSFWTNLREIQEKM